VQHSYAYCVKLAVPLFFALLVAGGCSSQREVVAEKPPAEIETTFIPAKTPTAEPTPLPTSEPTPTAQEAVDAAVPPETDGDGGPHSEEPAVPDEPKPTATLTPTSVPAATAPSPLAAFTAAFRRDAAGLNYCQVAHMIEARTQSIPAESRAVPALLELEARSNLEMLRLLAERAPAEIAYTRQSAHAEELKLVAHGEEYGWRIDDMLATWSWKQAADRAVVDDAIGRYDFRVCGTGIPGNGGVQPTPTPVPIPDISLSEYLFELGLGQASVNCIVEFMGGNPPIADVLPLPLIPQKCAGLIEFESANS